MAKYNLQIQSCSEQRLSLIAQLLELHRGQGMDIYWRDAVVCPTEEEYKAMVIKSKVIDQSQVKVTGKSYMCTTVTIT